MTARSGSVFIGLALGLALFAWGGAQVADFSPDDAALGPFTIPRDATYAGRHLGFRNGDGLDDVAALLVTHRGVGERSALWLGASHQYAINRYHPGEENAVWHANRLADERGARTLYVGVGLPNGNFNEFFAIYLYLRSAGALPHQLIVGALYDDLREPGVRPKIRQWIPDLEQAVWERLGVAGQHLQAVLQEAQPPVKRNAVDGTPQQSIESAVVMWLETSWPAFFHRNRLSAWLTWQIRARLFDIGEGLRRLGNPARRVPPVPPTLQRWNEDAMETLLQLAATDGVEVLVYKVPHPPTTGPFYHIREKYSGFHARLQQHCEGSDQTYVDLESLIDLPHWMIESALDYWHFDEDGHRLLAAAIDGAIAGRP